MQKSTIIIIIVSIVSALIILGGLTAGAILFAKQVNTTLKDKITEEPLGTEETNGEEIRNNLSKEHNAPYWTESLKTHYSYEVKEKAKQLVNQQITFSGSLADVVRENGEYFAILQDEDISGAALLVKYKLKCNESQVLELVKERENEIEGGYFIFVTAASIDSITEAPQDVYSAWSPPITINGTLVDFNVIEKTYEY